MYTEFHDEPILQIDFQKIFNAKWAWKVSYEELPCEKEIVYGYVSCYKDKLDNVYIGFYDENIEEYKLITNSNLLSYDEKSLLEKFLKYLNEEWNGEEESKRQLHGEYYYLTDTLEIEESWDMFEDKHDKRYKVNNYFTSREEAERKLERVKKAYQEVVNERNQI